MAQRSLHPSLQWISFFRRRWTCWTVPNTIQCLMTWSCLFSTRMLSIAFHSLSEETVHPTVYYQLSHLSVDDDKWPCKVPVEAFTGNKHYNVVQLACFNGKSVRTKLHLWECRETVTRCCTNMINMFFLLRVHRLLTCFSCKGVQIKLHLWECRECLHVVSYKLIYRLLISAVVGHTWRRQGTWRPSQSAEKLGD